MDDALQRRLDAALEVCAEAAALARSLQPPPGAPQASQKGAQDWLTEADGRVERLIRERLRVRFPADGFLGEEEGEAGVAGGLRWVADPIDGTSNFARGRSRWCVSLGLLGEGMALAGVLAAPVLGEVFAARRGGGASLNGRAIRVSQTTEMARAMVEVGWSPRSDTAAFHALNRRVLGAGAMLRAEGSGAMALADVACGRLDGYAELHIRLWDVAGGLAILGEAGAVASDFLGGSGPSTGDAILAAAPGVAGVLRGLVEEGRPEAPPLDSAQG